MRSKRYLALVPTDKRQRKKQGRQARLEAMRAQQARQQRRKRLLASVVVAVVVALVVSVFFVGDGDDDQEVAADDTTTTTAGEDGGEEGPPKGEPVPAGAQLEEWECPAPDGSSPRVDRFPSEPPPMCIDPAKAYVATLTTSHGDIEITLDTTRTPKTANNYVVLSRYHYYDGTVITRIDDSIDILQTGSPKTQTISDPGPGYNIEDEGSGFTYAEGDVVMARSRGPDSASAQYFLVTGPKASALDSDGSYVTFGRITGGLDVAKAIAALYQPCAPGDQTCLGGAPSELVTIEKIEIEER
jgi:cyclophilin family peptidyl-prolyl cis-trans isomerase